jgi:hypothetical protein
MDPSSLHGLELDTEQEEGMIPLTHFPLPVEYARAEQDAREANAGPHPYGTTEAYFARLYGGGQCDLLLGPGSHGTRTG